MKKQILDENISHKLSMQSRDIVAENIEKLRELFPNCFTEANNVCGGGRNSPSKL